MPIPYRIHPDQNDQSGPSEIMKANLDTNFRFEDVHDVFCDVLSV